MNFAKLIEISLALFDPTESINQHFSFITHKRRIISIGKSVNKTHPINLKNPKYGRDGEAIYNKNMCAELNVVNKFTKLTNIPFKKCDLYVIRVDKNKKISYSRPCSSCQNLIAEFASFKNVYFSNKNGELEKL